MKKLVIFILLQFGIAYLFAQHGIHEEYYFPHKSGQTTKLYQNFDSVKIFHCDASRISFCQITNSNKIINLYSDVNKIIYKLESIDSAYLKSIQIENIQLKYLKLLTQIALVSYMKLSIKKDRICIILLIQSILTKNLGLLIIRRNIIIALIH